MFRDGTLGGCRTVRCWSDSIEHRDETAFEAILYRHGAMVRNVCRQMLFDPHDVDDAVQSVFLVLVRKARFIRVDGSLGPWLYAVAGRVAARRGRIGERGGRGNVKIGEIAGSELLVDGGCLRIPRVIHDELGRLRSDCGRRWCSATSKG